MTSTALRVYTTVIALICGGAVAWSIHQSSITAAWQSDSRSWHTLAAQAVTHDRLTTKRMHTLVAEYDRLVVRTRKSQRKLMAAIVKAQRTGASSVSVPRSTAFPAVASPAAAAPVAVAAPAAPTTHTS
jgi:hypothetical protein